MKVGGATFDQLIKSYSLDKSNKQNANKSFKDFFNDALHKVNDTQKNSNIMTEKFALGEVDNIHEVMIASEKAKLSLDLTLEIRNKVVEAYKDIMRMQV
jgi:flagellar hook-basal body complex protein FliE